MTNTVLLAGSGNIGRRHLQALAALNRPLELIIIEPDSSAREATAALLAPITNNVLARIQEDWKDVPPVVDLAIIATSAAPRRRVLDAMLAVTNPSFVLFEKVLFTTTRDIDECEAILSNRNIPAAVNCGRRGFHDYDRLKHALKDRRGVSMNVVGSNWNMCSNGIHFLDLSAHLFADLPTSLLEDGLEPQPVPSRHPGCIEFFGTLLGKMAGGGTLTLTNLRSPGTPVLVELTHENEKWQIEEGEGRLTHQIDGVEVRRERFETLMVSSMGYLYTEILDHGHSRLPPYRLSAIHHRMFIDAIRRRLGMCLPEDPACPIS